MYHSMKDRVKKGSKDKSSSYYLVRISERWKSYDNFYYDICNKKGYNYKDEKGVYFSLDKDLLSNGKKLYSNETCCFLPNAVNQFLSTRYKKCSNLPVGVVYNKKDKKYQAQISKDGKRIYLGQFKRIKEAREVYCKEKNNHAKELAKRYKMQIEDEAYLALINYKEENRVYYNKKERVA